MSKQLVMLVLYVAIGAWTYTNFRTAIDCRGELSPWYWPPVTQCYERGTK